MANASTPAADRITVRLGSQAEPLKTAAEVSARTESELVRAALAFFLARHLTAEQLNAAVTAEKEAA